MRLVEIGERFFDLNHIIGFILFSVILLYTFVLLIYFVLSFMSFDFSPWPDYIYKPYLSLLPFGFWTSSIILARFRNPIISMYLVEDIDSYNINRDKYYSVKNRFYRGNKITFFIIIPTIGLIIPYIDLIFTIPSCLNYITYYSFLCIFLLSIYTVRKLETAKSIIGKIFFLYCIIGMVCLWFFPLFNPVILITKTITSINLIYIGTLNYVRLPLNVKN